MISIFSKKESADGTVGYVCGECGYLYSPDQKKDCGHSLPKMKSTSTVVPDGFKHLDIWFVWDKMNKYPLAPWRNGHMFPSKWGDGVLDDDEYEYEKVPETTYNKARIVSEMPSSEIEAVYSPIIVRWEGRDAGYTETDTSVPRGITSTVMLLPESRLPDKRFVFIDFDDVRNPATGEVTEEVAEIIERLNTYVEVSKSGTGLHAFVWGTLPDNVTQLQAKLNGSGHIEMYDSGRFIGNTWNHVEGTPTDLNSNDGVVEELIDEYSGDAASGSLSNVSDDEYSGDAAPGSLSNVSENDGGFDEEKMNKYYTTLDVRKVADTGHFADCRVEAPGYEWQGPHPVHGAQSGSKWNSESSNFHCDEQRWYCFYHSTGGSVLHLIPVLEGWVDCTGDVDVSDVMTPELMLRSCLAARDKYAGNGVLEHVEPPYKTLVGVAYEHDLPFENKSQNILGGLTKGTALTIYENMSLGDLE